MLELTLLPARQGDAIWLRWPDGSRMRQLIVDMGTPAIGKQIRKRLSAPDAQRDFELLVVTHIDADHIGGVISCVAKDGPPPGVTFEDVWFNGLQHLKEKPEIVDQSGAQGRQLMDWLATQPAWNQAFGRRAVCRGCDPIRLPGGLTITVLGPTRERLAELADKWNDVVTEAEVALATTDLPPGLRLVEMSGAAQVPPEAVPDLQLLAGLVSGKDDSEANGSSIALLVQYGEDRILLAGDAFAGDLVDALGALGEPGPVKLSAFKLPHHGSLENMTSQLMAAVDCQLFLFSSDGTRFKHPDRETVACVLQHRRSTAQIELGFNVRSDYNECWERPTWATRGNYRASYGDDADGLTLRFTGTNARA
jgi:beta-lactamase superfamily II metal-dependent hydrolase